MRVGHDWDWVTSVPTRKQQPNPDQDVPSGPWTATRSS